MDARRKSQVLEYQLAGLRGYLAQCRKQVAEAESPYEAEAHNARIALLERELEKLQTPGGP